MKKTNMIFHISMVFLLLSVLQENGYAVSNRIPKIGIIGGGIGGTACAWFLKFHFDKTKVAIDLYEASKIGGRLSVVEFSQNIYEEGGSIIHERNQYMTNFLKEFKLKKRTPSSGCFGLYNGKDFVFTESNWKIKTLWDIIHRYGLGLWKLKTEIDDMLNKFDRIYNLQNDGVTFDNMESLMSAIDPKFADYLHMSTKNGFEKQGIDDIIINELIMATIRANYGQNTNIQKMVGSVSVAGAFGNLWAIHGGNFQVPEHLLEASKANLIRRMVTRVRNLPTGQIEIISRPPDSDSHTVETYDIVIVATPQTPDIKYLINFEDFGEKIKFAGRYHKTVCTLIEGTLSEKYFRQESPSVDEILTVKDDILFNSIGRITPVDYVTSEIEANKSNVWKLFTQKTLEESEILTLFSEVRNKYTKEWLAYPHYESQTPLRNNSFILAPNLYHVNAIEWAASAMEMSAIGAKNVALLVYKNVMSRLGIKVPGSSNNSPNQHRQFGAAEEL